jgi:pimeloyl-ACP methyl ester carboxylesterase
MQWTWKAILWLVVALLVLAVVGAIYQAIATARAERAFPPPGEMVDVGGHRLHIHCLGQGSPTVVLDGGSGEMSAQWIWVQREVSDTTRVCAYDRAGMGWSEMGPEPRDAKQISSELHTLLTKAGIGGPYVLVSHSFGGLYMQTYAARYAEEVAGVALVESSQPDQFSQQPATRDSYEPQDQIFDVVSLLARLGIVRLLSKLDPAPPELPPQQRADRCPQPLDATSEYQRTRVSCYPSNRHPNAQPEEAGEQTAGGGHCRHIGSRLAQAAGRSGHSLTQQHAPCGGGGDAHISDVRAERRASDQRGHR